MKKFYEFLGFAAFWSICTVASFTAYALITLAFNKPLTSEDFLGFLTMGCWTMLLSAIYEGAKRGR
jgi:hypothetical protein